MAELLSEDEIESKLVGFSWERDGDEIVRDWKFENFCTLPARRFKTACTRSAIARTKPSGSFAFSSTPTARATAPAS